MRTRSGMVGTPRVSQPARENEGTMSTELRDLPCGWQIGSSLHMVQRSGSPGAGLRPGRRCAGKREASAQPKLRSGSTGYRHPVTGNLRIGFSLAFTVQAALCSEVLRVKASLSHRRGLYPARIRTRRSAFDRGGIICGPRSDGGLFLRWDIGVGVSGVRK